MFDLYDIYDTSEIAIIFLVGLIIILVFIILILYLIFNVKDMKPSSKKDEDKKDEDKKNLEYKKKYEALMKEKGEINKEQLKYSPSEFSTLLKYNPILPYSAFTWDIINNAYLDINEQSNYDSNYFSLANYDNIYQDNQNSEKLQKIMENVQRYKANKENNNNNNNNNSSNGLLNQEYMDNDLYKI